MLMKSTEAVAMNSAELKGRVEALSCKCNHDEWNCDEFEVDLKLKDEEEKRLKCWSECTVKPLPLAFTALKSKEKIIIKTEKTNKNSGGVKAFVEGGENDTVVDGGLDEVEVEGVGVGGGLLMVKIEKLVMVGTAFLMVVLMVLVLVVSLDSKEYTEGGV